MNYENVYKVVEGLVDDNQRIMDAINRMEIYTEKDNLEFTNKWVKIGHNGVALIYRLFFDDNLINGRITFESIYNQTHLLKLDTDLENKICEMIEADATTNFFNPK